MRQKLFQKMTLVLIVITVIAMLFSALFIVSHVDHDCSGSECQICHEMILCSENLELLCAAVAVVCAVVLFKNGVSYIVYQYRNFVNFVTPISQKVQMNN